MKRFSTLLLREWMQHRFGWIAIVAIPAALFAVVGIAGHLSMDFGEGDFIAGPGASAVTAGVTVGLAMLTLMLAWGAAVLQSPGLARRDVQDRSIEFWLSLPTGHVQGVGAPLLAHLVLFPLAALAAGAAAGFLISLPVVAKLYGLGAWFTQSWPALIAAALALMLRVALGLVLATLWLSPLLLGTMAASAWLKRWGVPAVAGVLGVGGLVLDRAYGNPVVWQVLRALGDGASRAFLVAERGVGASAAFVVRSPEEIGDTFAALPAWALADAGHALARLASPAFAAALLAGAAAFALLVLRRQRGA
ncbi:MAG: hypothetical protein U1F50_09380 [Rubrivivax sp.]